MPIPRLHKCSKCEAEGRRQFVGHDEQWCRIQRHPANHTEKSPQAPPNEDIQIMTASEQGEAP